MENVYFVTESKSALGNWLAAFPEARLLSSLPEVLPERALVWLHNRVLDSACLEAQRNGSVFVCLYDTPSDESGMEALSSGASGFCNTFAAVDVLKSIDSVVRNGGLWVGESLLNQLIGKLSARSHFSGRHQSHALLERLSDREREVALAVVQGQSNKEIARRLDVAERTIKAHLTAVFDKLAVRDRLQLAVLLNSKD